MLKGKSKAFKPKALIRRPPASTRELTREPTPREGSPSLKRKEREDDTTTEPPSKRIPTPPPTNTDTADVQPTPPVREAAPIISQPPNPTLATTSTQIPEILPEPRSLPTSAGPTTRKQLPSAPAAVITPTTTSDSPQRPAAPREHPSAEDEAPVRSTPGASLSSAGNAILSAPTSSPTSSAPRKSLPSTANPSIPPVRSAHRASLGYAGSSVISAPHVEATVGASLGPAGSSVISNNRNQNAGSSNALTLGPAGDVGEESEAGPSRVSQVVPMAALNPDGTPGGIMEGPVKKKKKVVRRKQAKAGTDDARATIEMQLARPRLKKGTAAKKKKKRDKRSKKRQDTPESAEDEVIDPASLTMSELCKDLRIGKKFSRHNDIKERIQKQKDVVKAARRVRNNPEVTEGEQPTAGDENVDGVEPGPVAGVENASGPAPVETVLGPGEPAAEEEINTGPQGRSVTMRIVDGQIVVDERSTQIDRHRDGQVEAGGEMEIIEENDFTKITTSGTYMKREKNQSWDWPAMEMFYKGLRTFGTDFGMIANMFPHRTRKQIKLRFNKEERENPERVNKALSAPPLPIDFDEYEDLSQGKYLEVEEIEAEQKALEDEHNAAQAKHEADHAATIKKKKDAINAKSNAARDFIANLSDDEEHTGGGSSAKENRAPSAGGGGSRSREQSAAATSGRGKKKTNAKASKANKHAMRAGGEELEILGTVD